MRLPWWDAGEFLRRRVELRAERNEDRVYLRGMSGAIVEDTVLYIRRCEMGKGGTIIQDAAIEGVGGFAISSTVYIEIFHDHREFRWTCGYLGLRSRLNPSTLVRSHRLLLWPMPGVRTSLWVHSIFIATNGVLRNSSPPFTTTSICLIYE